MGPQATSSRLLQLVVNQTRAFALNCRMRIPILIGLLFLPLALHAATGCAPLPGTVTPNVRWPQVWQALTDQSSCTQNCHVGDNGSAGLDLSNLTNSIYFLVSQQSQQSSLTLVDAGNARNSLFFLKVNCTAPGVGAQMPPGGGMPATLQALIYDWIEQGAYGENPEDPATRDFIFKDGAESQRR